MKVGGRNEESFSGLNLNWLMAVLGPRVASRGAGEAPCSWSPASTASALDQLGERDVGFKSRVRSAQLGQGEALLRRLCNVLPPARHILMWPGFHKHADAKCKEAGGLGQNAGVVDQHGAEQGRSVRWHHRSWSF